MTPMVHSVITTGMVMAEMTVSKYRSAGSKLQLAIWFKLYTMNWLNISTVVCLYKNVTLYSRKAKGSGLAD